MNNLLDNHWDSWIPVDPGSRDRGPFEVVDPVLGRTPTSAWNPRMEETNRVIIVFLRKRWLRWWLDVATGPWRSQTVKDPKPPGLVIPAVPCPGDMGIVSLGAASVPKPPAVCFLNLPDASTNFMTKSDLKFRDKFQYIYCELRSVTVCRLHLFASNSFHSSKERPCLFVAESGRGAKVSKLEDIAVNVRSII